MLDAGLAEGWKGNEWGRWNEIRGHLAGAGVRELCKTDRDGIAALHASGPETYPHQERLRTGDEKPLLAALDRLIRQFGS